MDRFQPSPKVREIRERLDHPVIDSDGHLVELRPVAMEYIAKAGGADMARRFAEEQRSTFLSRDWYGLPPAERMARWTRRPPFWGEPLQNRGLDLATATFPDVPTSHPFFQYVEALYAAGITAGYGNGSFGVNDPISRGQMAVFLSVALGLHWPQ